MKHPSAMKRWICLMALASVAPVLGCSSQGPPAEKRYKVTGTVQLDGAPVESGVIKFLGLKGTGGGDAGTIKNGTFSLQATPGEKRVEIAAAGASEQKIEGKDVTDSVPLIPEKYNTKSELKETVEEGPNEFAFDLKSK